MTPARLVVRQRPMRVLDFDIENRPLSYLGSDFTTAEVTAIAWAWCDRPEDVTCVFIWRDDYSFPSGLGQSERLGQAPLCVATTACQ